MAFDAEARQAVAEGRPTPRQKLLLRAIWELTQEQGYNPTFREIADRMGVCSLSGITEGLNKLQRSGWIVRHNLINRSMRLTRAGIEAAEIYLKPGDFDWRLVAVQRESEQH